MVVVQIVEIIWTKATRGAPRALERVTLPRAFALDGTTAGYVVQRHRMRERESFRPDPVQVETKPSMPRTEGVLYLLFDDENRLSVGLTGVPHGGRPKRHPVLNALRIGEGEFGRLIVNARHTGYSGQHYAETVFNVTHGSAVPADRFLQGLPEHEFNQEGHLF